METRVHKQSILNTLLAAAGDIDTTTLPGKVVIPGLNPIPAAGIKRVVKTAATAEVAQFITIEAPTIVADTRYAVRGHELQATDMNKIFNTMKPFATTSAAVLSGVALTDQVNVVYSLGWRIMQLAKSGQLRVNAGPIATFTNATTAYAGVIGDTIEGITSGAKAVVASVTGANEKVVIMLSSNDFTDTEAVKINGVVTTTTAATNVYTGNLGILDDAGYFPAMGHRKGKSSWIVGDGFAATALTVTRAAVYGFGIGARMLDDVPRLSAYMSPNLNSGQWNFATNALPLAANTYTRYIIVYDEDSTPDSMNSRTAKTEQAQAVWVHATSGNFGAFDTAILALA